MIRPLPFPTTDLDAIALPGIHDAHLTLRLDAGVARAALSLISPSGRVTLRLPDLRRHRLEASADGWIVNDIHRHALAQGAAPRAGAGGLRGDLSLEHLFPGDAERFRLANADAWMLQVDASYGETCALVAGAIDIARGRARSQPR